MKDLPERPSEEDMDALLLEFVESQGPGGAEFANEHEMANQFNAWLTFRWLERGLTPDEKFVAAVKRAKEGERRATSRHRR